MKVSLRIASVVLIINMLIVAFELAPVFVYASMSAHSNDSLQARETNINDLLDSVQPQKIFPSQNSTGDSFTELDSNTTDKWAEFVKIDGNAVQLIVGVSSQNSNSNLQLKDLVSEKGGVLINTVTIRGKVRALVADVPLVSATSFMEDIKASGLACYVEPNMRAQAQYVPDDPYWSMQWGPQKIEADWAWNITTGNHGVTVAIVDTGIHYYHEDLVGNYISGGYDWINHDSDPLDDHGHGTHCAGIVAASLNNSIGIAGLAQVQIMAEKVLDSSGSGTYDSVANGIIHATDMGANIISMSLGGYGDSELLHEAVRYAYDSGVLVIAAAGNDNTNVKFYPAAYEEVLAVSATDRYDNKATFSNWGDWIELAAPGVDIYSSVPWGYESWSGTSMATPHVSGLAALVWSLYPNRTREWMKLWLEQAADDLGDPGRDVVYGYGRINARKAIERAPPEHDLIAYSWKTPPYVEPGNSGVINATILNFGDQNETDVVVKLLADGVIVDSTTIDFLLSGNFATTALLWTPVVEGSYNVTLYVEPVPGEASADNNVLQKSVYVGHPEIAVVLHSAGNVLSEAIVNWQALNDQWQMFGDTMVYIDYTTLNIQSITYADIAATGADVLIISCAYDQYAGWQFTDLEIEAIRRYVQEGHGLIATAGTLYYMVPNNRKLAPLFGLNDTTVWDATQTDLLHQLNTTHPLFRNVPNPFIFSDVGTSIPSDRRWDSNELVDGKYLATGHYQESAIVVNRGLVYISPWLEVIPPYYHFHLQMLYNAITWSRYAIPEHEIKVSIECPHHIDPGQETFLNASVLNAGLSNETSVELQLLINDAVADSEIVPELLKGASYTLSYLWTPSVEGTYNITAYAPPVPDEEFGGNNVASTSVRVGYIIASVAVLNSLDVPAYFDGGWSNNYQLLVDALNAQGFYAQSITNEEIVSGELGSFDIFVMVDNVPNEVAVPYVVAFWSGGGGLMTFDSSICFLNYAGVLPPESAGSNGYGTYWDYGTRSEARISVEHPVTEGYEVGEIIYGTAGDAQYRVDALASSSAYPYYTVLVEDETVSNRAYVSAYDFPPVGKVVQFWDQNHWGNANLQLMIMNAMNWVKSPHYEHDLAVSSAVRARSSPGQTTVINATVRNMGLSNETDVELLLLIDDTVVDSATIPELATGSSYKMTYLWTPGAEGTYNVTAYAPPVPNEDFTVNNVVTKYVEVSSTIAKVAILNSLEVPPYFAGGWSNNYQLLVDALDSQGFYAEAITNEEITAGELGFFDVFVMVDNVPNEVAVPYVVAFWSGGGGLVAFDSSICFLNYAGVLPPESAGSNGIYTYWDYGTSNEAKVSVEHPITEGYEVGEIIYGAGGDSQYWVDALSSSTAYPYYTMVVEDQTRSDRACVSAYAPPIGGKVVQFWDQNHWGNANLQLMIMNAMNWVKSAHYEHDLAVFTSTLPRVPLGQSVTVNATVLNVGLSNETDVELQLLINGFIVNSATIPEMLVGTSYTLSYPWTPSVEGTYNITAYAPPVPNENFTMNNIVSKTTLVSNVVLALISDNSELLSITPILDSIGVGFDVYNDNRIHLYTEDLDLLLAYRMVIFNNYDRTITSGEHDALEAYLSTGGNLLVTGYDSLGHPDDWLLADVIRSISVGDNTGEPDLIVIDGTHPIMNGPYGSFPPGYYVTGLFSDCDAAEADVARNARPVAELSDGLDKIIATDGLPGRVVYWNGAGAVDWTTNGDCAAMLKNTLVWFGTNVSMLRDVAVINVTVSSDEIYEGQTVNITVVVLNEGNVTETFGLSTYYDSSLIGTQTVTSLMPGENSTVAFTWNTSGVTPTSIGYTIKAIAALVPGEGHTSDNIYFDGNVRVKIPGDLNGDGIVDIYDAVAAAGAYGSHYGDENWISGVDLVQDGLIDIYDMIILATHFGETY